MRPLATILVFALLRLGVCSGVLLGQNPAVVAVPRTEGWWVARHQAKVNEVRASVSGDSYVGDPPHRNLDVPQKFDLVFVGDSITQNYEKPGPAPNEVFLPIWTQYFAPHHALNLGFSGDRTEHVLWRLQHGEFDGLVPKDIVLLIGTNNTDNGQSPEQVTEGSVAVIDELHRRAPRAKIMVIDILPTGGSRPKQDADAKINVKVRDHFAGAAYVRFLDLRSLFMQEGALDESLFYDPSLVPPRPALHPNTAGQRRMAQAVAAALYR